jgi:hypothetical protein
MSMDIVGYLLLTYHKVYLFLLIFCHFLKNKN